MCKVIIIEGCDRVGKDSLIAKLKKNFNNAVVIHAGIPSSKDLFKYYYNGIIHDTLAGYYDKSVDCVIHNRSMYGEYVYGPKYREESKSDIADMIYKLETGQLKTFIKEKDLHLILLTSSDSSLLANNDDGLSLSAKKTDIDDEIAAFNEVFNLSSIKNKKKIFVNNDNRFRSKEDIYKDALDFINNTQGD